MKRTLIVAFVVLSAVAVIDMAWSGVSTFGSIFDQTFGQFDAVPRRMISVPPNFEETRALDPLAVSEGTWVTIDQTHGDLEIARAESASGQASVAYTVQVWGSGDLSGLADDISVIWEREGEGVRFSVERPRTLPSRVRYVEVDAVVLVPPGTNVSVIHSGDVRVDDLVGELKLDHTGGVLDVRNVNGPVTVNSRFSTVSLNDVAGEVALDHSGGEVSLRNVVGSVSGQMHFGEVRVASVSGDVRLSASQGAGSIAQIGGDVELTAGFGNYEVADVDGFVELDLNMGRAVVSGLKGAADLSVQAGDLAVSLADGPGWTVDAVVDMGNFSSEFDLSRDESGPRIKAGGVIGDGANDLSIDVRQGSARLYAED